MREVKNAIPEADNEPSVTTFNPIQSIIQQQQDNKFALADVPLNESQIHNDSPLITDVFQEVPEDDSNNSDMI